MAGELTPEQRDEIHRAAIEYARRSRAEQGLPPQVTDPQTLARIRTLFERPEDDPETA